MQIDNSSPIIKNVEGKMIYILGNIILVQFIYPITESNSVLSLIVYQLLYATLFGSGMMLTQYNPRLVKSLAVLGVIWLVAILSTYVSNQTAVEALIIAYFAYEALILIITAILFKYVFRARNITRDVLFAAIAIYLLLGAVFIPVYGLIESLTFALSGQHAFTGGQLVNGFFAWQDFNYYSYVTLTTLGYGDILPVTMLAKVAVSIEAIIGVMYLTIIMARLVSLYSADINQPTE